MTKKRKLIAINIKVAKDLERMLEKYEVAFCTCDEQHQHLDACPSKAANQLRNYLTRRINNPNRK